MLNKRGIELSVNFLVVLIISIAVIGFGIRFTYKLVGETSELQKASGQELDQKIGELLCADDLKVCVGIERKKVSRGKADLFGVKILNIEDSDKTFDVYVEIPKLASQGYACGFDKNNNPISDTATANNKCTQIKIIHGDLQGSIDTAQNPNPYAVYKRPVDIPSKKDKTIAIAFEVQKGAVSGTYIYNINVKINGAAANYAATKKLYIEVP